MKPITITVLKFSVILFSAITLLWLALFIAPFNIPEYIPHTPVKIYGFFFIGFILTVFILAQKKIIKLSPQIRVGRLTLTCTIIGFISEILFQSILSTTSTSDKFYFFCMGVFTTTMVEAGISFLIAFYIKTKKIGLLFVFILCFGLLIKAFTLLFPLNAN